VVDGALVEPAAPDPLDALPSAEGLYPGAYPHIPEPMVFDLVRGLGAARGELEANALAITRLRRGAQLAWAPELEWAFADGHAVELELPMINQTLDSLKLALQGTLPERQRRFIHGWQLIGERFLRTKSYETTALYLAGVRPSGSAVSLFAMTGARLAAGGSAPRSLEWLVNPSLYVDLGGHLTVGLENNLAFHARGRLAELYSIPQVHWQMTRHMRLQIGGGVSVVHGQVAPVLATRLVLE
jgi:hypothetical protein